MIMRQHPDSGGSVDDEMARGKSYRDQRLQEQWRRLCSIRCKDRSAEPVNGVASAPSQLFTTASEVGNSGAQSWHHRRQQDRAGGEEGMPKDGSVVGMFGFGEISRGITVQTAVTAGVSCCETRAGFSPFRTDSKRTITMICLGGIDVRR